MWNEYIFGMRNYVIKGFNFLNGGHINHIKFSIQENSYKKRIVKRWGHSDRKLFFSLHWVLFETIMDVQGKLYKYDPAWVQNCHFWENLKRCTIYFKKFKFKSTITFSLKIKIVNFVLSFIKYYFFKLLSLNNLMNNYKISTIPNTSKFA